MRWMFISVIFMLHNLKTFGFKYTLSSCLGLQPSDVTAKAQGGVAPYRFTLTPTEYTAGEKIRGVICSPDLPLANVFVMANCYQCWGDFYEATPAYIYSCDTGFGISAKSNDLKAGFVFYWEPFSALNKSVQFIASVVYNDSVWWTDIVSPTLTSSNRTCNIAADGRQELNVFLMFCSTLMMFVMII